MATPGRSSFAGTNTKQSPSFRDIARQFLPQDREKTFSQVISIAAANFILIFLLVTCYAIHTVLLPFLRPLLLALMFGSFLYPLKRSFALFLRQVISDVREDEFPILAGLLTPFRLINNLVNHTNDCCYHYTQVIISFGTTLIEGDFSSIVAVLIASLSFVIIGGDSLMNFSLCFNLMIFLTQITKTDVSFSDAYLQFLIRSFGLTQFCWLCPQILYLLIPIIVAWICIKLVFTKVKERFISTPDLSSSKPTTTKDEHNITPDEQEYDAQDGNEYQPQQVFSFKEMSLDFYRAFLNVMESYIDAISTLCVIALVMFIVNFTAIYLSFQIYTEGVYLIERLSGSFNYIVDSNPDLKQLLPEGITGVQGLLDGAVNNTYQHGREWIIKSTRQLLNNAAMENFNTTQSTLIEKQMVEFWDRAYVLWLKNRNGTETIDTHSPYDWNRLLDALKTLNFTLCTEIFKQNWETLISIMDSVGKVMKGNLSLVLGMITALFSLVIVGGNALFNFIINFIIFTTALFNLLCASDEQYKPIQLIKTWAPPSRVSILSRRKQALNNGELWSYVDESINAVFTASLKIMAFQGLSTWLLHRMFQLEVVYIPSVISMIFGAVPIISPYWASVPAIIDLCWSEHWSQGLLMLLFATLPSSFVISTFYSEIKG